MEYAPKFETGKNEYGWTEDELKMPMMWGAFYLDVFPSDGSNRQIKSSARWNGYKKQVLIRATDGFVYVINGVSVQPDYEEIHIYHQAAQAAWLEWYAEEIARPENSPNGSKIH